MDSKRKEEFDEKRFNGVHFVGLTSHPMPHQPNLKRIIISLNLDMYELGNKPIEEVEELATLLADAVKEQVLNEHKDANGEK